MIVLIVTLSAFDSPAATRETVAVYFKEKWKVEEKRENELFWLQDEFEVALETTFYARPEPMKIKVIKSEDIDEQDEESTYLDKNPQTKYLIKFEISPPPYDKSSTWGIRCTWYESGSNEGNPCWITKYDLHLSQDEDNKDSKREKREIVYLAKNISLDSSIEPRLLKYIEHSEPDIVYFKCFHVQITDKNTKEAIEKATIAIPAELKYRLAADMKKHGYIIEGLNPTDNQMICFGDRSRNILEPKYDYQIEGIIAEKGEGSKVDFYIKGPDSSDIEAKIYQIKQQPVDLSGKDTIDLDFEYLIQRIEDHILKYLTEKNSQSK
jgi:hypothetical protein